jgi:hypothetical protein
MAPEVRRGLPFDGRSDQYSLALTVERFLLPAASPAAPSVSLPPAVLEVLRRATSADAAARYATCDDFAAALRRAGEPGATSSFPIDTAGERVPLASLPAPTEPHRPQNTPSDAHRASIDPPRAASSVGLGTWSAALVAVVLAAAFAVWLNLPPAAVDPLERDRAALLGSWRNESGLLMEFLPDGKLREQRLFDVGQGTYEVLPDRKIRMKTEGMFGGLLPTGGEGVLRYQLGEKELALATDSGIGLTLRYQRVP